MHKCIATLYGFMSLYTQAVILSIANCPKSEKNRIIAYFLQLLIKGSIAEMVIANHVIPAEAGIHHQPYFLRR